MIPAIAVVPSLFAQRPRLRADGQSFMSTDDRHDRLFRTTFSNVRHLEVELRAVLAPELAAGLDFESLRILRTDFEIPGLVPLRGDLLVEAKLFGEAAVLALLVEHQSSVDPLMALRCLGYQFGVWTEHVKRCRSVGLAPLPLPVVIPIVVHHSKGGWTAATSLQELFSKALVEREGVRRHIPHFAFLLDDLARFPAEEILARARREREEVAAVVLLALRYGWDLGAFLRALAAASSLAARLVRTDGGVDALRDILRYFQAESGREFRSILERAVETVHATPETREAMTSIADLLINEGRVEGEVKGRVEGRVEMVMKLLTLKFGEVSEETRERVSKASLEELDGFAERILFAATLKEVLR